MTAFIAVCFGDSEDLVAEIEGLTDDTPFEFQGEYIGVAEAYATDHNPNPVLSVLHFIHSPADTVEYEVRHYS